MTVTESRAETRMEKFQTNKKNCYWCHHTMKNHNVNSISLVSLSSHSHWKMMRMICFFIWFWWSNCEITEASVNQMDQQYTNRPKTTTTTTTKWFCACKARRVEVFVIFLYLNFCLDIKRKNLNSSTVSFSI